MVQRVTTGHEEEKVVLSGNVQNAALCMEDGNRRATNQQEEHLISSQELCAALCAAALLATSVNHGAHFWTHLCSAFLPALTFLCLGASLLFTYLGARRGANVLVVTSSWSCTSSCPWCQIMALALLLMEPRSALIHYWSSTAHGGQESFKTAFQDACRCRKFKSSLFLSVYSQMFSLLAFGSLEMHCCSPTLSDKAGIPCSTLSL